MARTVTFWAVVLLAPFVALALFTYLPDSTFRNVPLYLAWAILEAIALLPGLVLILRARAERPTKMWGAAAYVVVCTLIAPFALIFFACTLHPCAL